MHHQVYFRSSEVAKVTGGCAAMPAEVRVTTRFHAPYPPGHQKGFPSLFLVCAATQQRRCPRKRAPAARLRKSAPQARRKQRWVSMLAAGTAQQLNSTRRSEQRAGMRTFPKRRSVTFFMATSCSPSHNKEERIWACCGTEETKIPHLDF